MSILLEEINDQPRVIKNFLDIESENIAKIIQSIKNKFSYIIIAARGSSDNAARYAQYLFGIQNSFQVALATPSLFTLYNKKPDMNGALVIGISQSGESPDIVSVISHAAKQGRPTIAITNNSTSPLAKNADHVINLQTGQEKAIAATKTYTTSLCALALISIFMNHNSEDLDLLKKIPSKIASSIESCAQVLKHTERYRYADHFCVIGRGYNYSTAFEISLKIKELNSVVAEPYSSADFRHGPIATIKKGFPVIFVAPKDNVYSDVTDLLDNLNQKEAEIILISDHIEYKKKVNLFFQLPEEIPVWLKPIVAVIPGQLFAFHLAAEKGLDPDSPVGLRKITQTT